MTDKELKDHWYTAYAMALAALQHSEAVTERTAAAGVKRCGDGVFNRLFCLAVWQEVKLAKAGEPSIPPEKYKDAVTDTWRVFRRFADGDGSDTYWDNVVDGIGNVINRYGNCQFIMNLAIHVTLEAIEDIQRRKQPAARQETKK